MRKIKNIFMCLVHEKQDCIIDLVRNLRYLDKDSTILLYNGGTNNELFSHFPFEKYNVIIHPSPKPLQWGWLHDFALDCMEYAIQHLEFDTITVVDSDQLACGRDYSSYITNTILDNPNVGMLGQIPTQINSDTTIDPAITAYQEKELWQPFLDQLPNGKDAFLYWTFWPSTVFTYRASVALVDLFSTNIQLQKLLTLTKIWASEEILLPTLTVALGFSILENPSSYDTVKYKEVFTSQSIQQALDNNQSFWIHPVLRTIKDPTRAYIRQFYSNYNLSYPKELSNDIFKLIKYIKPKIEHIEGWLENDELELLVAITYQKAISKKRALFLEIGSYCGKATSAIALVIKYTNSQSKVIAIDDCSGKLGAEDTTIDYYPPSYDKIKSTIDNLQLSNEVTFIKHTPHLTNLEEKIDFILIDGLHDYANVARDFYNFEINLKENAYILFHDHSPFFPGVVSFVKELINDHSYQIIQQTNSLIVLQKNNIVNTIKHKINAVNQDNLVTKKEEIPLVSCIMPTYNRSNFIAQAIDQFLKQSYPNKELIILDDSDNSIASLIPNNPHIKYTYLNEKLDIGSKRNKACAMSKGQYIIHLDDDDFYAPDWIEKQLSFLIKNKLEITGLNAPLFYDTSNATFWKYEYPLKNKPWVYGATLCYTKKIWQSNPFPITNCGEDNAFVWSEAIQKIQPNDAINSYLGQIHHKNTSPKQTTNNRWSELNKVDVTPLFTNHSIASIPIFIDLKNETNNPTILKHK